MIRPIIEPSLSSPIASYPTSNLRGEKQYPLAMEVIEALEWFAIFLYWLLLVMEHLQIACFTDCVNFQMASKFLTKQKKLYMLTETFTSFVIHHISSRQPETVLVLRMHITCTYIIHVHAH